MFKYKEIMDGLSAVVQSMPITPERRSHCQLLELEARRLGFKSYYHMLHSLKRMPARMLATKSIELMQKLCARKLPRRSDCPYFEFLPLPNGLGYYSYWVGWDENGDEVREPRPLDGRTSVEGLRHKVESPVYVVESDREFIVWKEVWGSRAYLPEWLAHKHLPKCFNKRIASDPPMDLVIAKASCGRYADNMTGDIE